MPRIACPLQSAAQKFPQRSAIVAGRQTISYAELHLAVKLTQEWLKTQNIHQHSRVTIIAPNSVDYLMTLWALWRQGAAACLLNPKLPAQALETQFKEITPSHLLVRWPPWDKQKNIKEKKYGYHLNQEATILFTSGSSGQPKAVVHSFGNHYYNALGSNEHIRLKKNDRWLLSLPLYHVSGLGILFRVLLAGATVVLPAKKESLQESIRKYRITHISLVPTQLYRLLQHRNLRLPSLKVILVGGAPIPENLLEEAVSRKLPIYTTYGLTEMASQVATSDKNRRGETKILKYRQMKIVSGEICVKGKTLFKGYMQGQKVSLPLNKEGWFKTGDLGILRYKKYLTVLGRKDNMFISGGENIQPEEIERHLHQIKEIEKAVVVPIEDKEFGFRPAAFVKMQLNRRINPEQIRNHLKNFLPSFKIPDQFLAWPRGQEGFKVSRSTLACSLILSE